MKYEIIKHVDNPLDVVTHLEDATSYNWQEVAQCSTENARRYVSYALASKLCALPLAVVGKGSASIFLSVLLPEPLNANVVKEVAFVAGIEIVPECLPRNIVEKALHAAYCGNLQKFEQAVQRVREEPPSQAIEPSFVEAVSEHAVPQLLTSILDRGISLRASDIHLEPEEQNYRIRFRIDGKLQIEQTFVIAPASASSIIRRIQVLAELDLTKSSLPQEAGFRHRINRSSVGVRVSIMPQAGGRKVVLRLLDEKFLDFTVDRTKALSTLGLLSKQKSCLIRHLGAGKGAILIAGPTGSGKSTLLYAMLHYLNQTWRNIVTIEDPVERRIPGVNQTEVKRDLGLDYQQLLPALLRQDPDVMMLGEIREAATAKTALTAGITGHLVLSTVHAGDCFEIFSRLFQLGIDPSFLSSSVRLFIAQRLLAKNCVQCIHAVKADEALCQFFQFPAKTILRRSLGCKGCNDSGIRGRVAVFEMLPLSDSIRKLLMKYRHQLVLVPEVKQTAFDEGYRPYAFHVREMLQRGLVSPEEALRCIGIEPDYF